MKKKLSEISEVVQIQAPRSIVLMVCVVVPLVILAVATIGFWLGRNSHHTFSADGVSPVQNSILKNKSGENTYHLKPGPWGDFECQKTFIEIPDEYLSIRVHEAAKVRWFFEGYSAESLMALLNAAELSAAEKSALLDKAKWDIAPNGIYINPPTETILSLSPASRAKIYNVLMEFDENPQQQQSFHWPVNLADSIFANPELSSQTRDLVKKLCYSHARQIMFADLPTVLNSLPNEKEKRRLEKALSRRPTLLMRIILSPKSDTESLMKYWGIAGSAMNIRPILEAAASIPEGTKLSILNLLPPGPTARLFTYPFPTVGAQVDCHWTSFNFFKDIADPPTTDGSYWKRKLDLEYYPVLSDPRYGDLVMLVKPNGAITHSCVFLADNIVYTKNGANATVPWMLMTMPDLLDDYQSDMPEGETLRVNYYRNKSY